MMMANLFLQGGAFPMRPDSVDLCEFLNACAAGDTAARQRFQETCGEDIYNFPVKIYGTPIEEAGDFYLYVFDKDRIFIRLKTFEGRNSIQFRTFLSYYVLKHLFIEWRRTRKEIETISLQTPVDDSDDGSRTLEDILPGSVAVDRVSSDEMLMEKTTETLKALTPEEQLHLKLLSLLENPLNSEDICLLAEISGRTVHDTLMLLAEVQDNLKQKDEKLARMRDELDSVWGWIVLRQKELQELNRQVGSLSAGENVVDSKKLLAQKHALEHTLAKRTRQRERLVEEIRTYKLTTPYRDIARMLNSTIGAVYARIFHLREQLAREYDERESIAVSAA
jgi:DNA-directed RNA polymerase specialized sigma24 family protein